MRRQGHGSRSRRRGRARRTSQQSGSLSRRPAPIVASMMGDGLPKRQQSKRQKTSCSTADINSSNSSSRRVSTVSSMRLRIRNRRKNTRSLQSVGRNKSPRRNRVRPTNRKRVPVPIPSSQSPRRRMTRSRLNNAYLVRSRKRKASSSSRGQSSRSRSTSQQRRSKQRRPTSRKCRVYSRSRVRRSKSNSTAKSDEQNTPALNTETETSQVDNKDSSTKENQPDQSVDTPREEKPECQNQPEKNEQSQPEKETQSQSEGVYQLNNYNNVLGNTPLTRLQIRRLQTGKARFQHESEPRAIKRRTPSTRQINNKQTSNSDRSQLPKRRQKQKPQWFNQRKRASGRKRGKYSKCKPTTSQSRSCELTTNNDLTLKTEDSTHGESFSTKDDQQSVEQACLKSKEVVVESYQNCKVLLNPVNNQTDLNPQELGENGSNSVHVPMAGPTYRSQLEREYFTPPILIHSRTPNDRVSDWLYNGINKNRQINEQNISANNQLEYASKENASLIEEEESSGRESKIQDQHSNSNNINSNTNCSAVLVSPPPMLAESVSDYSQDGDNFKQSRLDYGEPTPSLASSSNVNRETSSAANHLSLVQAKSRRFQSSLNNRLSTTTTNQPVSFKSTSLLEPVRINKNILLPGKTIPTGSSSNDERLDGNSSIANNEFVSAELTGLSLVERAIHSLRRVGMASRVAFKSRSHLSNNTNIRRTVSTTNLKSPIAKTGVCTIGPAQTTNPVNSALTSIKPLTSNAKQTINIKEVSTIDCNKADCSLNVDDKTAPTDALPAPNNKHLDNLISNKPKKQFVGLPLASMALAAATAARECLGSRCSGEISENDTLSKEKKVYSDETYSLSDVCSTSSRINHFKCNTNQSNLAGCSHVEFGQSPVKSNNTSQMENKCTEAVAQSSPIETRTTGCLFEQQMYKTDSSVSPEIYASNNTCTIDSKCCDETENNCTDTVRASEQVDMSKNSTVASETVSDQSDADFESDNNSGEEDDSSLESESGDLATTNEDGELLPEYNNSSSRITADQTADETPDTIESNVDGVNSQGNGDIEFSD